MPEAQLERFVNSWRSNNVQTHSVEGAGHFAGLDKPEEVVSVMINFISRISGRNSLADIFIGLDKKRIWKGDERGMIEHLRKMHLRE